MLSGTLILAVHNLLHPGIRTTAKLISKRFVMDFHEQRYSELDPELCACLGISKIRTTPTHPSSSGLGGSSHRFSKPSHGSLHSTLDTSPSFCSPCAASVIKEDINATAAEMV
ncbi:hypothetical protein TNIN_215251 [Trichonephila inaurata madagascariensis]|uniref:Uncharacterized protein n=1 Tax=Trichonephila inaurata madagascariensis TaxID=2747483 RepID=A0A8X6XSK0_9ARAC|nr:hypothetical protein TNIN_215251 [Trichonephila inaurata madagascariensis]